MSDGTAGQGQTRRDVAHHIRSGEWMELAETLGFDTSESVTIPESTYQVWGIQREAASAFDEIRLLSAEPGFRLILVRGAAEYRDFRRLVTGLERRNAEDAALWWWDREETALATIATRRHDGRIAVETMDISRDAPEAVALEAWCKLDRSRAVRVDRADGGAVMRRHLAEAFDHGEVTRAFFREFSAALDALVEALEHGPEAGEDRHQLCLAALLRMVFVYFLQRRGMLDGDKAFVLRHLRRADCEGDRFTDVVLKPLYFGALNRPLGAREALAARLGDLPFLNGGLFEPLPVEQSHPEFSWSNEVWLDIIEGLFERYHFAATETRLGDGRNAVDPEMLGRVFEGLMYGSARLESGSFYTPRDVVRSMVETALGSHLADRTEISRDVALEVVTGDGTSLSGEQREQVRAALDDVSILDPAVGTGAFLLEALHTLRCCWSAVGWSSEPRSMAEYEKVRSLMHRHLFGVDIQQTAVRLCELRMWLALLETMPALPNGDVPPLPNLAHRVCAGNSLVSPMDLVQLEAGAGPDETGTWGLSDARGVSSTYVERAGQLRDRWLTSHGEAKRKLKRDIEDCERRMHLAMLESRRRKLEAKLAPFEKLASSEDLFGDAVELDAEQRRRVESLHRQLDALEASRREVEAGRVSGLAFSYAARFASVIESGGFDIVVTNPPWVRANRIDDSLKSVLKQRYRSYANDLWEGAAELGIRAPFGAQTDLAALFLERSLELLAPGGHLCALVPSKLFRSLHGSGLREQLMEHDILRLEDHSDADRKMFAATVYPAVLHARKAVSRGGPARRNRRERRRPPRASTPPREVTVTTWRGGQASSWTTQKRELPVLEGISGSPWLLVERGVGEIIDEMRERSTPMGATDALEPRRGFFTGCNAVFLMDEARARAELGESWEAWTRPVVRGRDCREWTVDASRRVLWGYDERLEARTSAPDDVRAYLDAHRARLEGRSDFRQGAPLWQLFRLKQGLTRPKVLWRDLSPKLEATYVGPDIAPLNTVYFVAFDDRARARVFEALLNSEPVRSVAYALGERARGGWRRHFSWVMRLLPVPHRVETVLRGDAPVESLLDAAELRVLDGDDADEKQALADRLGARWFALEPLDVERLRQWRSGASSDDAMEVAA